VKIVEFKSMARFSPEKMQKHEVFAGPYVATDIYCFEPGQVQKAHKHATNDKIYFVLEGTGRFTVGRTTRELKAGTALMVSAGEDHGVVNMAEERLILLVVIAPPIPPKANKE
jgi:quercetin dioxygenase-like cupin family protein